ncbi:MAG: precorrin-3B C(17)-methyltransferase [Sphaerospermopsis sp. SIO1G2]|nr:precorrin-3B C(17)-methyltransferase [Sphaerospermopsis sp. SIO1G2]
MVNPDDGKKFIADLLAGAKVKLEGTAPWLSDSNLPIDENGELIIKITEKEVNYQPNCLVYHPQNIALTITSPNSVTVSHVHELITSLELSPHSVTVIFAPNYLAKNPILANIAHIFKVPVRFFTASQLTEFTTQGFSFHEAVVFSGTQDHSVSFCSPYSQITVSINPQIIDPETVGKPQGKLAIIGTGPGATKWMSPEVKEILNQATDLVGYKTYINLIGSLADGKNIHESDNREEEARAKMALDLAAQGKYVAVVSSGDPGIYAMATAIFEVIDKYKDPEWQTLDIQVAPGISAMQATAAAIGAPLGHDFCVISLSDILKPWEIIAQRIENAAQADFAIAFYNPVSKYRTWQLTEAKNILLKHRNPDTPVVLGWNMGRPGQAVKVINLQDLEPVEADMRTLVIVGSSQTQTIEIFDQDRRVYTPRRYS